MEHKEIKAMIQDRLDNSNVSQRHPLVDMAYTCMDIVDGEYNALITEQAEKSLKKIVGAFIGYCEEEGFVKA